MTDPRRTEQDLEVLAPDFDVRGEVARGGMSVVYRAFDRTRGIEVAVKVLRAKYLDDDDALARFTREARVAVGLEHPNIVRTYELRELSGDSLALVMQFVDGQTLRQMMREGGRVPIPRAERIIRDICEALGYAHRRGIVHRDVKPENIFLDTTGNALLSDFGIALSLDADSSLTRTGVTLGTPNYMSPEQIDNLDVDGRGDLYSLALVGWEMLSGTRPWEGENVYGVLYKQKNEYLPLLDELREDVPASYMMAIEGALAKEPEQRWGRAEEMSAQLAEAPLRAAVRRRRAIAHGTGIYKHSKAGKDEATIRLRLPRVDPPEMPTPTSAAAEPKRSTPKSAAETQRRRRAPAVLAVSAFLVLGVGVTMAALRRSDASPSQERARTPAADVAAAAAPIPEAVQLVREADSSLATGSRTGMVSAIDDYERALDAGVERAPVLARLALGYALLAEEGGRHHALRDRELVARASALTDSALRVSSPPADAWLARAALRSIDNASTAEITGALRGAREANAAHPELRRLEALTPAFTGNLRAAAERLAAAARSAGASARSHRDLIEVLLAERRYAAALTTADSAIARHPRMGALYTLRARAEMHLGDFRAAWSDAEVGARLGDRAAGEALYVQLDARGGELAGARTRARSLLPARAARRPATMSYAQGVPYAAAFAAIGDRETALDVLQRIRPRSARLCLALQAPELDPLRSEPGFARVAQGCAPAAR